MNTLVKLLILVLVALVAGCSSTGSNEENGLNSHEHKLLLSADKFEDLDQGFVDCWDFVKVTAAANDIPVIEFGDKLVQKHNKVAFYDTHDLKLSDKGFLIRKRWKMKDGHQTDALTITLKFKSNECEVASAADVMLAEGYKPKADEIEVESDIIDGFEPDSESAIVYSVQNSTVLDHDLGTTLSDYAKLFPVLKTLGIDLTVEIMPVNGIEVDEYIVKPGRIDFGNDIFGRVDISVWMFDGKIIPEVSYDHPLELWDSAPQSSIDRCESFVGMLQSESPEWCVKGKLKAAFVFEN